MLTDTDGDGKIDKSIVFAENITEGTSMLFWKGGVIVTAAPYILYLKDTNGEENRRFDTRSIGGYHT